jgi:predicted ester cyclase
VTSTTATTDSAAEATEARRDIVRRLFEDGWGRGDLDLLPEIFAPEVVILNHHAHMTDQPPYGAHTAGEEITLLRGGLPDLSMRIVTSLVQGEWVMSAWEGTGTHLRTMLGLPPTGRSVRMTGVYTARVVDGRITEARNAVDTLGYTQQFGAVPGAEADPADPADYLPLTALRRGPEPALPGQGPALVHRLVEEVMNDGGADALDGLFHPGRLVQENLSRPVPGDTPLARSRYASLLTAAPDLRISIDGLLTEGDLVGYGWFASGTHTGPMGRIPATGRTFTFMGNTISRVVDNRIGDTVHVYDAMALLEQIGKLPPVRGGLELFG